MGGFQKGRPLRFRFIFFGTIAFFGGFPTHWLCHAACEVANPPKFALSFDPAARRAGIPFSESCVLLSGKEKGDFVDALAVENAVDLGGLVGMITESYCINKAAKDSRVSEQIQAALQDERYLKFNESEIDELMGAVMDRLRADAESGAGGERNLVRILTEKDMLFPDDSEGARNKAKTYGSNITAVVGEIVAASPAGYLTDKGIALAGQGTKQVRNQARKARTRETKHGEEKLFDINSLSPPNSKAIRWAHVTTGVAQIGLGITGTILSATGAGAAAGYGLTAAGAAVSIGGDAAKKGFDNTRRKQFGITAQGLAMGDSSTAGHGRVRKVAGTAATGLLSQSAQAGLSIGLKAATPQIANQFLKQTLVGTTDGIASAVPVASGTVLAQAAPILGGIWNVGKGGNDIKKAIFGFEQSHEIVRANEQVYHGVVRGIISKRKKELTEAMMAASEIFDKESQNDFDVMSATEKAQARSKLSCLCEAVAKLEEREALMEKRFKDRFDYLDQIIDRKNWKKRQREHLLSALGQNFEKRQEKKMITIETEIRQSNAELIKSYGGLIKKLETLLKSKGQTKQYYQLMEQMVYSIPVNIGDNSVTDSPKGATMESRRDHRVAYLNDALQNNDALEKRIFAVAQVASILGFADLEDVGEQAMKDVLTRSDTPIEARLHNPVVSRQGKVGSPEVALKAVQRQIAERRARLEHVITHIEGDIEFNVLRQYDP